MKRRELAGPQKDGWRKIAVTLINLASQFSKRVMAC
jgi:hypothetical protein